MRRVRKEEVQRENFIQPDGLERCLECWKIYMQGDERKLAASKMNLASGVDPEDEDEAEDGAPIAFEYDLNDEQRKQDNKIGAATDAMIDSLPRLHYWAIYRMCSITTQWNFPNAAFQDVAEAASMNLRNKLRNNIATATLF